MVQSTIPYLDGVATIEADISWEIPVHGACSNREDPGGKVGNRARLRAGVAGGADDGDPALDGEERADGGQVGEVVGGRRAEGEGEDVHAVRHRLEDGGQDVDPRAARLVARLVHGDARARRAARGRALAVAVHAGAPDEGAARGGQRVRAVPHVVPRRRQVRLARRRLLASVAAQGARRLDALAEEPRADQLPACTCAPSVFSPRPPEKLFVRVSRGRRALPVALEGGVVAFLAGAVPTTQWDVQHGIVLEALGFRPYAFVVHCSEHNTHTQKKKH